MNLRISINSTINPTVNDIQAMSDGLVSQLLDHNKKYDEFCK